MKFKTIEEAEAAYTGLKSKLAESEKAKVAAEKGQKEAEDIAKDALGKLKVVEDSIPKKLTAKVDGKTFEVIFGVDGLTKEELAKDKEKLAVLVKSGSSAIKLLEGK